MSTFSISVNNQPKHTDFNLSVIFEGIVQMMQTSSSTLEPAFISVKEKVLRTGLLQQSSVPLEMATEDYLLGDACDLTLKAADAHFLNSNGYILLALQAICIAAKDILDGQKENAKPKHIFLMRNALEWLNGDEPMVLPFADCVKLLDYEIRFQSMNTIEMPDIANNPQILSNWIKKDPAEAVHYLRNYQNLFNSETRSVNFESKIYEDIENSVNDESVEVLYATPSQ